MDPMLRCLGHICTVTLSCHPVPSFFLQYPPSCLPHHFHRNMQTWDHCMTHRSGKCNQIYSIGPCKQIEPLAAAARTLWKGDKWRTPIWLAIYRPFSQALEYSSALKQNSLDTKTPIWGTNSRLQHTGQTELSIICKMNCDISLSYFSSNALVPEQ